MPQEMGVPLPLVDRASGIRDQLRVSYVFLKSLVQGADGARPADSDESDNVAVVGDTKASLLQSARLLINVGILNPPGPAGSH